MRHRLPHRSCLPIVPRHMLYGGRRAGAPSVTMRSAVTAPLQRALARFLRHRGRRRFTRVSAGDSNRDLVHWHAVPLEQLLHAVRQRTRVVRRGVMEEHTYFAVAEASDEVAPAQMLAEADDTRLRQFRLRQRVRERQDHRRHRYAGIDGLPGQPIEDGVEPARTVAQLLNEESQSTRRRRAAEAPRSAP